MLTIVGATVQDFWYYADDSRRYSTAFLVLIMLTILGATVQKFWY